MPEREPGGLQEVERALRGSESRWRAIIDSAVDAIIVIDAHGRMEAFNPAAERLFGYANEEVLGQNVSMLMPEPYHEEHDRYLEHYLTTGVQKIIGVGREVTGLRKDGSTFPVHLSVGEMVMDGQPKFTGILHDLTGRVEMETRLREQSALTKLGEMAAVVAHEVKNPLAGIRGAIQVIGGRLPAGSKDAAVVKEIIARVDALNDLMKDLLLFARPPTPRFAPMQIVSLLQTVADLVRQDPALNRLRIDVVGSVPPVTGDAELLKIIVQNLILNAVHATEGRGVIRVAVVVTDGGSEITVADNGPGIASDVREKLFTPFFTTKARGTGLGLCTAKRLIEAQGGAINLDCPREGGTVVTLQLPVHRN
jgi:two-component system sensor kinase FixL